MAKEFGTRYNYVFFFSQQQHMLGSQQKKDSFIGRNKLPIHKSLVPKANYDFERRLLNNVNQQLGRFNESRKSISHWHEQPSFN